MQHTIILINDLESECLVHKYFDDTTLSEFVNEGEHSFMDRHVDNVLNWSRYNLMNINCNKTKEMIIGRLAKQSISLLHINDNEVQRVNVLNCLVYM